MSTTLISAVSAGAGLLSLAGYLYSLRRAEQTAAREEALALAETRGEMVTELRRRVTALERSHKRARAAYEKRIHELDEALELTQREAREEAYQMQRLYAFALTEALTRVAGELEETPPDVEGALAAIRSLLGEERLRIARP